MWASLRTAHRFARVVVPLDYFIVTTIIFAVGSKAPESRAANDEYERTLAGLEAFPYINFVRLLLGAGAAVAPAPPPKAASPLGAAAAELALRFFPI